MVEIEERDQAHNIVATYIQSSKKGSTKNSRIDVIVRVLYLVSHRLIYMLILFSMVSRCQKTLQAMFGVRWMHFCQRDIHIALQMITSSKDMFIN